MMIEGVPLKMWLAFKEEAERRGFSQRVHGEAAFRSCHGKTLRIVVIKGVHRLVELNEKVQVTGIEDSRKSGERYGDRLTELKRRKKELEQLASRDVRELLPGKSGDCGQQVYRWKKDDRKRIEYLRYVGSMTDVRDELLAIDSEIASIEACRKAAGGK